MAHKTTHEIHKGRTEDDTRTNEEVRPRRISRRGVLGSLGALTVLMGVPVVRSIKPGPSERLKSNASNSHFSKNDIKKMMKLVKKLNDMKTEADLSDCLHVINPNRMVDMRGHATMARVFGHQGLAYKMTPICRTHEV